MEGDPTAQEGGREEIRSKRTIIHGEGDKKLVSRLGGTYFTNRRNEEKCYGKYMNNYM